MKTLYELGQEIMKIREAVNSLEVKGQENARFVIYCFDKCNGIIQAINNAASEKTAPKNESTHENNTPDKKGDVDG